MNTGSIHPLSVSPDFSSGGHLSSLAGTTNGVKVYKVGDTEMDIEGNVGDCTSFSSRVDAVVDWFGPIDMTRMENCATTKGADSPEAASIGGTPAEHMDVLTLFESDDLYRRKGSEVFGDSWGCRYRCSSLPECLLLKML